MNALFRGLVPVCRKEFLHIIRDPGTLFFADGRGADTVRLSFSLVDEAQIDEGVEKLGALL